MRAIDFFPKFIDAGMTQQTSFGALISLLVIASSVILCGSEAWTYLHPPLKEEVVSVSDLRGVLRDLSISFNFTLGLPCALLHVDAFDLTGMATSTEGLPQKLFKTRLNAAGKPIPAPLTRACGSCYGAESDTVKCCKTCEDVLAAYQAKSWSIGGMTNWSQCAEEGIKTDGSEKCRLHGSFDVNAVDGTFHIAPGVNVPTHYGHQHDYAPLDGQLNLSHEIDHLTFGAALTDSPLDRTKVVQTEEGEFHYRYNLKAVPQVVSMGGVTTKSFLYTVNFAEIPVTSRGKFGPGIFFLYSFAPVAVFGREEKVSFAIFLARCVAIIGGSVMIGRLVDSLGFRLNTLEGKMKIGKGE
jgi:hypothetical protein